MRVITIAGGVGRDAEFKTTQKGDKLCSFSVAADDGFGDQKSTIWFDVTRWGNGADKLAEMLVKGTKVTVIGTLSTREHDGKTYLQVRADHVKLQGDRQAAGNGGSGNASRGRAASNDEPEDEDFIPFVTREGMF
jgi:single-strand DNA-binding protein